MADDGMDIDTYDPEEVQGGGGYVDDDLDLDDDDDDEPLVSAASRATGPGPSPSAGKQNKRRTKSGSATATPDSKKRKASAPRPDDYLLRAAGAGRIRDYIVAKFVTRIPDLSDSPHVRLYRNKEPTVQARKEAIEADRKQQAYFNSFSGRRRLLRYEKQRIVTIPDRYQSGWTMEVTPRHLYEDKLHRAQAQKESAAITSGLSADVASKQFGANQPEKAQNGDEKDQADPDMDVFEGTFDGKSTTSRYAIMVLSEGSKTVDVVPLDDYAWFSFRASRAQGGDSESAEAYMAKTMKKGENRISKFQVKYEEAQNIREQNMGDNTRVKNSKDFAAIGIRRNKTTQNADDDDTKEELDFEEEFDNDDVAQVDKESVEKTEKRVLGDAEQNAKEFRKMIKDEPMNQTPASPRSDSDEDGAREQSSKPPSRSPSPSRPASASRSPNQSAKPAPMGTSKGQASRGTTPLTATPIVASPSPNRSPRGNTPQKLDLSHLLPPPGVMPTSEHVIAVLRVLLQGKQRIPLKELVRYFEMKTKEHKANIIRALKQDAVVVADPVKSKNYYISWKRSASTGNRQLGN